MINLIYNITEDNILGINNQLVVKSKEDLQYFKKITTDEYTTHKNIVIMGYNTWKSIGETPLTNRINIIISSSYKMYNLEDVFVFSNLEACFDYLNVVVKGNIFIIGGSMLFEKVLHSYFSMIDKIYCSISKVSLNISDPSIVKFTPNLDKFKNVYQDIITTNASVYNNKISSYEKQVIQIQRMVYQSNYIYNYEQEYLDLLKSTMGGKTSSGRNGETISQFGTRMTFNLLEGFPLLTTKKMPWKTILRELLWFISGSTDNKILQKENVHIWDQNASRKFLQSRGLDYEDGDLGPIYGFQWRYFGAKYIDCNHNYKDQGVDQLQSLICEIKKNPTSRRLILNSWNAADINKMALPPCHVMFQLNIDGEFIDAQLYQRSGDMFLGVPFNIASYSFLLYIIGSLTGYKPRYLHHVIGDAHIYECHIKAIDEQLCRGTFRPPKITMKPIQSIDTIKETDFQINDYISDERIFAEMIT